MYRPTTSTKCAGLAATLMAAMVFVFVSTSTNAALVVYEGFNYSAGAIDGSSQAGGTGMSGAWSTSVSSSTPFSIQSGGLTFGTLDTEGSAHLDRASAPGGAEANRAISGTSQTALTADGSTIWFSLLMQPERFSVGNENGTFVFGTDTLSNGAANTTPTVNGSGEAFGLSLDGNAIAGNPLRLHAYSATSGIPSLSSGYLELDPVTGTQGLKGPFLIAGKIEWGAGTDTLRLFNITDPVAILPGGAIDDSLAFATITANLNQALFDTLATSDAQITRWDEIRFGTDFATVLSGMVQVIPEPSTVVLLGVGGAMLLRYRRRSATHHHHQRS